MRTFSQPCRSPAFALAGLLGLLAQPAAAELVLDRVIVDLEAGQAPRDDIEVMNMGEERMYVLAEPFEILDAGLESQARVALGPPSETGMFVSPLRMILEPGERRLVRIAATGERPASDRVFRVRIRPVVGEVVSQNDALKVLVGYDALVLLRASEIRGEIEVMREGQRLTLVNRSNSAQELFAGQQCRAVNEDCQDLPATRLYPGQRWSIDLPYLTPGTFKKAIGSNVTTLDF
mgnify:CR=1 FL=1